MKHTSIRRGVAGAVALATATFGLAITGPSASAGGKADPPGLAKGHSKGTVEIPVSETGSYIVVLADDSLTDQFDQSELQSPAAQAKGRAIASGHDRLLDQSGVGSANKLQSYRNVVNGFAATMSHQQAQKLSAAAGVTAVLPDELRQLTTDASGDFLGLSGEGGVWSQYQGEDVVIGVIDSGIWPEHPSVADDGTYGELQLPPEVELACDFGGPEAHLAAGLTDADFECNNKLIGARYTMPTYVALTGLSEVEYESARDENGHGTHTATTAAGNADVQASIFGIDRGAVTGVAPRARVIAYKALGELGGYSSDLAGAIDQAVADQVDVINYSIGSSSFAIGLDDIAFFDAALAGVHVATSNGNSGPGPATIGSPASVPWLTSVGASTHDRNFEGGVTIFEGVDKPEGSHRKEIVETEFRGASVTGGTDLLPLVDAAKLNNELCDPSVPFRGKVENRIVLCKRGVFARVDKSLAVDNAGGAGMVLYNENDGQSEVTDSHWVPSVHINNTDGLALKQLLKDARQPLAQISGGVAVEIPGSSMAAFSSRGENSLSSDIIKPDVTAPGVNILAGNTPTPTAGAPGDLFQSISGTSMSSPHVAGLMALIVEAQPDWSPAAVKSALMTTARQDVTKEDGVMSADPFDMGAGHVDPPSMFDPGLVYDAGILDYAGFTCAADLGFFTPGSCDYVGGLGLADASNFNQASIGVGDLAGSQSVMRSVTNVTDAEITVAASFDGLEGVSASMSPAELVVPSGETVTFSVDLAVTTAPVDVWEFGSMTLSNGDYSVYSPIAVRPVTIGIPDSVSGSGVEGSATVDVSFGYSGPYSAAAHGLVPASVETANVLQDPDQVFDPSDGFSNTHTFETSGDALLRVAIPPEATEAEADLDIFLADPTGTIVAASTNGGTDEVIDIQLPTDGTWTLYVQGWAAPGGDSDYTLYAWTVSATPGGTLTIDDAPTEATIGTIGTVDVSWTAATESEWHLGAVSHADADGLLGLTVVEVDNR